MINKLSQLPPNLLKVGLLHFEMIAEGQVCDILSFGFNLFMGHWTLFL